MRLTYVAFPTCVIGPDSLENSLETLRTHGDACGVVVDSQLRVLAFRKSWDAVVPIREQLDKHNDRINSRIGTKSLPERI